MRDVIAFYQLSAKKSLGQNFLLDLNLTARIAREAGNLRDVNVIEIGPGPGGLTRALLDTDAKKIIAVEKDRRFIQALSLLTDIAQGRFELIEADALETDLTTLCPKPRAIGANLPYNIATPLLLGWLKQENAFEHITVMLQKEVALRLIAEPGSDDYGRLSIVTQWLSEPRILFDVPPSAFVPPPKVTSSIVHLTPRRDRDRNVSIEAVEKITAAAFGQRRKMLRKSLQQIWPDPIPVLEKCGIDPTERAERLSLGDFLHLAALMA